MNRYRIGFASVIASCICSTSWAATPTQITVQGRLTDTANSPLPAGSKTFHFRIFDASTGGIQMWPEGGVPEIQSITSAIDGLWVGLVGAVIPLTDPLFMDTTRWLELTVDGTTLPRVKLVTAPSSFRVATVDGASGGTITSKVAIGTGHTNSGTNAFVAGQSNSATGAQSNVPGGVGNIASGLRSTVGGGQNNRARGQLSVVAGGGSTTSTDSNSASGNYSMIPGGRGNIASGDGSFAAGFRARALHNGSFVWADEATGGFSSGTEGQFVIAASGGVDIECNAPAQNALSVSMNGNPGVPIMQISGGTLGANDNMLHLQQPGLNFPDATYIRCQGVLGDVDFQVWTDGDVTADGTITGGGADFAELIRVSSGISSVEAGDVMVIDPYNGRTIVKSSSPHSTLVAGVYSTAPGFVGSTHDWDQVAAEIKGTGNSTVEETGLGELELAAAIGEIPLAIVGIVPCKVTAENGAIRPGDLLVTASLPGHAMRADDPKTGTILGKALGALNSGRGVIEILVTLH